MIEEPGAASPEGDFTAGVRRAGGVVAGDPGTAVCAPVVPDECCLTHARQLAWLLKLIAL